MKTADTEVLASVIDATPNGIIAVDGEGTNQVQRMVISGAVLR